MTEDASPNTPAPPADKPAPRKGAVAAVEQAAIDAGQHIEAWFQDLLASLPQLRETATYNRLRRAIDDLKKRLS